MLALTPSKTGPSSIPDANCSIFVTADLRGKGLQLEIAERLRKKCSAVGTEKDARTQLLYMRT